MAAQFSDYDDTGAPAAGRKVRAYQRDTAPLSVIATTAPKAVFVTTRKREISVLA